MLSKEAAGSFEARQVMPTSILERQKNALFPDDKRNHYLKDACIDYARGLNCSVWQTNKTLDAHDSFVLSREGRSPLLMAVACRRDPAENTIPALNTVGLVVRLRNEWSESGLRSVRTPCTTKVLSLIANLQSVSLAAISGLNATCLVFSYLYRILFFQDHDLFFFHEGQETASVSGHINDDSEVFKNTLLVQLL